MRRPKKYDKPRSEYKDEKAKIVFGLLIHHPYFLEECERIRSDFEIPKKGYSSKNKIARKFYEQKNQLKLYQSIYQLLNKFNIPHELNRAIFEWSISYILLNEKVPSRIMDYPINFCAGEHLDDIGIEDDYIYIEVTPYTTLEDIKDVWLDITHQINKGKEAVKYKFNAKKVPEFGERLYELTEEGYSRREAVEIINKEKGKNIYTWNKSSNSLVHNALNEYKRRLNELKKI